ATALVAADVDVDSHAAQLVAVDDRVGDVLERGQRATAASDDLAGLAAEDLGVDLAFGHLLDLDGVGRVEVEQQVDEKRLGALHRVARRYRPDAVVGLGELLGVLWQDAVRVLLIDVDADAL